MHGLSICFPHGTIFRNPHERKFAQFFHVESNTHFKIQFHTEKVQEFLVEFTYKIHNWILGGSREKFLSILQEINIISMQYICIFSHSPDLLQKNNPKTCVYSICNNWEIFIDNIWITCVETARSFITIEKLLKCPKHSIWYPFSFRMNSMQNLCFAWMILIYAWNCTNYVQIQYEISMKFPSISCWFSARFRSTYTVSFLRRWNKGISGSILFRIIVTSSDLSLLGPSFRWTILHTVFKADTVLVCSTRQCDCKRRV